MPFTRLEPGTRVPLSSVTVCSKDMVSVWERGGEEGGRRGQGTAPDKAAAALGGWSRERDGNTARAWPRLRGRLYVDGRLTMGGIMIDYMTT